MAPLVGLVLGLTLLEYVVIVMLTGRARVRSGIRAPAVTGDPIFERWFRVQQNTLEQLIVFVPALLLFGQFVSARWPAFLLGTLFIAGRALYARAYVSAPDSRSAGFILGLLATAVLLLGGLIGAALAHWRP
jgi:glutathione S-transferase